METTGQKYMTPGDLLDTAKRTWSDGDNRGVLGIVTSEWPAITSRSGQPEDAETCRLAMIAAAAERLYPVSTLWQARALVRFVALDWHEGAAAVIMAGTFRLLAMANDDYAYGHTYDVLRPAPEAVGLLEDLMPFTKGAGRGFTCGPTPELIARFVHEKSGFLLTLEHRWDDALEAYDRAMDYVAPEPRGQVKVPLGRAVLGYLSERDAGRDGQEFAAITDQLSADKRTQDHDDLSRRAKANLDRMREGRLDLVPYEIL